MSETLFLTKLQTLAQMFFCEFCKIFKNTFFTEHFWTTASEKNRLQGKIDTKCVKKDFVFKKFSRLIRWSMNK